ncbi:MAG: aminotransferase class I/II-fold pyridoxal phosphate-dependent enzyme, partial [Acholeplasmataceae bacterium]|nr:aminotransferase class I/II-fold pyridoxal phosphate-dependent enzyme [Acholeplasmataceae bacterium]
MVIDNLKIDILSISKEASLHKEKDKNVINATLGVLLDEKGSFMTIDSVDEALEDVSKIELRKYLAQDGGFLYKENIYNYLFKDKLKEIKKHFNLVSNWSSGGSGALSLAFQMHEGVIYIPNISWPEYNQIANNLDKEIKTYPMFDKDNFNLNGIEEILKKEHKNILLILNDPAHNPTGYTMNKLEYEEFFKIINKYNHVKLLVDIAYIDFSDNYFEMLIPMIIKYKINVIFTFSGSKSYLVYGVRMGLLIYFAKTKEEKEAFLKETKKITTSTLGSPNSLSILLLNEIVKSKKLYTEQKALKEVLRLRSKLFISLV